MSFLSVAFLFALPLIAAPLALHLFDRRRKVEIQWGAMAFLVAATNQKTSSRRFKQWLLLLMRMLAIAALVFALARPLVPGGWLGGNDREELIVIVDNSMSMSRSHDGGTFIELARDRAIDEVAQLNPNDRVRMMTSAPYPVWNQTSGLRGGTAGSEQIAAEIATIDATLGRSDLLAAIMRASSSQSAPLTTRRRILVLTDGQSGDLRLDDTVGWERLRNRVEQASLPTQISISPLTSRTSSNPVASSTRGNVAVDRVSANRMLVGVDHPVSFTATIHNHAAGGVTDLSVQWHVGDHDPGENDASSSIHQQTIHALDADQTETVRLQHAFPDPGVYRITCGLNADDDLIADNRSSVVVEVVDEIPILIVEGQSQLSSSQQDSFFVRAALGWLDNQQPVAGSVHVPTIISTEDLTRHRLDPYRCVVIPNLIDLEDAAIESLRQFVFDGGGLWVALGPRTNVDRFNTHVFAGGELSPLAVDAIVDDIADDASATDQAAAEPVRIDPFGQAHPATAVLSDHERLDLGDVAVQRRFRFAGNDHNANTAVLLSLTNGQALAVETMHGRGRVITQAIPLHLSWSDLATSEAFVVMVRDWVDYLAQPKSTRFNLEPGDPVVFQSEADGPTEARLRTPSGEVIELTADTVFGKAIFRTNRTRLPGSYEMELGLSQGTLPFEVARDPAESDLSPLSDSKWSALASLAGLRSVGTQQTLSSQPQTDPLWPWLLLGLIALMAGDLILSGFLARERFGTSEVAAVPTQPMLSGSLGDLPRSRSGSRAAS